MEPDSLTPNEQKEIIALMERTNREKPNAEDVRALRAMLESHPRLWRVGGDLALQNQQKLLNETRMSAAIREMVNAALDAMQRAMGFDTAPMLEQMLIENVLLSWLRLYLCEFSYTELNSGQGMSLTKATFWEKRLSSAQSRYLRAVETLARVRRLMRNAPTLQVNIASERGQQVNVAGDIVKSSG
jgi:hypothetical protein